MKTIMKLEQLNSIELNSIEDIKRFLNGTDVVAFNVVTTRQERYQWIHNVLKKHQYRKLGKLDKGTVTQYLMKVTAYSKAQIKRLIRQFIKTSDIKIKTAGRNGFKCRYTPSDIRLLAEMDERHQQPSGAVIKKLCERSYQQFGQNQYQNLGNISVSHLYNLRRSKTYQRQRCCLTKTRPKKVSIGIRRKPCPNDQPGYIRIDSV
jgi:hypothetical protein